MKRFFSRILLFALAAGSLTVARAAEAPAKKVFILPIREDIDDPLVYLVRRGVKAAMDAKADVLILDMETNGGKVSVTEDIIQILGQFKGQTVTYVNRKAFSAGAFISVATQKIYMSPQSVIGAAAPILMAPGGSGVEAMPDTVERKMTSGIRALVRTSAEKNGHNVEVIEAMIDKNKELKIDGKVLNEKGQILTLTNLEAEREYGTPAKPLLSLGTAETLDDLVEKLGLRKAQRTRIEPTGAEQAAFWLNAIAPILLIIGVVGIYIEFKTPGFGLPGVVGIVAFALYFLGGYVAGLSGIEWVAVFLIGLILIALELFVFPGVMVLGGVGALLMLVSIVMAMVDLYPAMPAVPTMPGVPILPRVSTDSILGALQTVLIAAVGVAVTVWVLSQYLPKTTLYSAMVSGSASGEASVADQEQKRAGQLGQTGEAISPLRPGGKAKFGDQILDVMTQGEMLAKGAKVKIIGFSGTEAVVEAAG